MPIELAVETKKIVFEVGQKYHLTNFTTLWEITFLNEEIVILSNPSSIKYPIQIKLKTLKRNVERGFLIMEQ